MAGDGMIAARQIAFCNAGSTAKPYKARLEYIESSGTQYITAFTGTVDNTFGLRMDFSMVAEYDNFPAGFSTTNNNRFLFWGARSERGWSYGWGTYTSGLTYPIFSYDDYPSGLDNYHTAELNYLCSGTCSLGDSGQYIINGVDQQFKNIDFRLFRSYSTSSTMSRIRKAILTKKSKVIRSLIPVLDFNYVPCMFDEMSSEFFYNQGKGEFITGPEITEK